MLSLTTIATGSTGNCYLLNSESETLVIEAGVRFSEVKKALGWNITRIVGLIVTHSHGDHAKYLHEYEMAGIPVWRPYEDENPKQKMSFGGFTVRSFDCVHNVPCVGYLISHPEGLKMLYATDTEYVAYTFRGLTAMLIEANYSDEYIDANAVKFSHVKQGHMSIDTCLGCIRANMNQKLSHIILCHLSADGADPVEFKARVTNMTGPGVMVDVAKRGQTIELTDIPF